MVNFTDITQKNGLPCTICNGTEGRECEICYGLGYVCPICFNKGIGYLSAQPCDCKILWQRNFYYEALTYKRQALVTTHETDYTVTSTFMEEMEREDFIKHTGYTYTRFALLYSQPMDFLLYRRGRLAQAIKACREGGIHPEMNAILGRGMLYISIPELEMADYAEFIQKALQANSHGVLVFFGASLKIPSYTNPYLNLIKANMKRPMFAFCDEAWVESYQSLLFGIIDEEADPNSRKPDARRAKQIFRQVR